MARPIGIDLFSGVGGLSLGFEQAGFDVVAAVEIDPVHASVHAFNFPHCAVIPKSVKDLTGNDVREAAKLGNRRVDVVFGGAPCQGFSMMGRRVLDDPRNALVRDFVRLVHELDSKYFVFENVKGITVGKHRAFLDELIGEFEAVGYVVKLPWQVLNAAHYGVPQSRERLILMGCKKGMRLPDYPMPITRAAGTVVQGDALPEGPSCLDALGDIADAEQYDELWTSDAVRAKWKKGSLYAKRMRGEAVDERDFSYPRRSDARVLTSSARTQHTELSRHRFANTPEGAIEPVSRFFKLPSHGVSNTLRAGTDSARGAFTSPRPIHYKYARCITVREMARLHGFPDWFRFHHTKWHGARQIGNAVPPPLGKAVAETLIRVLRVNPVKPQMLLELGPLELLNFDMGQASTYFGVSVPIAQRTRKLGKVPSGQQQLELSLPRSNSLDCGDQDVESFALQN